MSAAVAAVAPSIEYCFGRPEVEAWAHFSGDFNPIHFDRSAAQRFGQSRLVVHGMLATLRAKAAVWRRFEEARGPQPRWARLRTLFRQPLAYDQVIVLSIESRRTLAFRMNTPIEAREHFRGSCAELVEPEWRPAPEATGQTLVPARASDFATTYPDIDNPWIVLDAILFSRFMGAELDGITALARTHFMSETAEVVAIVHSSHTVDIDTDFMSARRGGFPWDDLTYGVMAPAFIPGDSRLVCTIPLWVRAGKRHIMSVEIGVVVITHPSNQDPQP